jgi:hypothetical protein
MGRRGGRATGPLGILAAPAAFSALMVGLCAAAAAQCWHLWQVHERQAGQLARLEAALGEARVRHDRLRSELERNFDPSQIPLLLRERYGLLDASERIIRLEPTPALRKGG